MKIVEATLWDIERGFRTAYFDFEQLVKMAKDYDDECDVFFGSRASHIRECREMWDDDLKEYGVSILKDAPSDRDFLFVVDYNCGDVYLLTDYQDIVDCLCAHCCHKFSTWEWVDKARITFANKHGIAYEFDGRVVWTPEDELLFEISQPADDILAYGGRFLDTEAKV